MRVYYRGRIAHSCPFDAPGRKTHHVHFTDAAARRCAEAAARRRAREETAEPPAIFLKGEDGRYGWTTRKGER